MGRTKIFYIFAPLKENVVMKNFDEYEIQFAGLKEGQHEFYYDIDKDFLALFDYEEFGEVDVDAHVLLNKKPNEEMELAIGVEGSVNVVCGVSLVPYDQPIELVIELKVKFGEEYNDDHDDEWLVLPHGAHYLEIQQYIYEAVVLAVPYKKVHPKVVDGTMESEILDKLDELSPENNKEKEKKTDPRWDKLKDLL
ncbi:MAG TPA: DUF177 domain-containing protein [Flavobacteriaceae bacterium]|nr:DUF177 domain-containing protein [Flavobacteriaceae bacterium]